MKPVKNEDFSFFRCADFIFFFFFTSFCHNWCWLCFVLFFSLAAVYFVIDVLCVLCTLLHKAFGSRLFNWHDGICLILLQSCHFCYSDMEWMCLIRDIQNSHQNKIVKSSVIYILKHFDHKYEVQTIILNSLNSN